jgi:hypothetical protein
MIASKYIVDIIGSVVSSMRVGTAETPYYLYGVGSEIRETLTEWTNHKTKKFSKFPLIILIQDFSEDKGQNQAVNSKVSLNIILCKDTLPSYRSADRYTNVFKPVLYPLYDLFLAKLTESGYFLDDSPGLIAHKKTDHVFWGRNGLYDKAGNVFSDYIDAIEIENMELEILNYSKNL